MRERERLRRAVRRRHRADRRSSVTVAPDGRQVFVTAAAIGGVTAYARDADTGALDAAELPARQGAQGRLVHERARAGRRRGERDHPRRQDAASWRAPTDQALALFARNAATGALTPSSCFVAPGSAGRRRRRPGGGRRGRGGRERPRTRRPTASPRRRSSRRARSSSRPTAAACSCSARRLPRRVPARPRLGRLTQTGCAEDARHLQVVLARRAGCSTRGGIAVSSDARSLYVANPPRTRSRCSPPSVAIQSRAASADRRGRFRVKLACPAARVSGCAGGCASAPRSARLPRARGRLARRAGAAPQAAAPRRAQARARAGHRRRARLAAADATVDASPARPALSARLSSGRERTGALGRGSQARRAPRSAGRGAASARCSTASPRRWGSCGRCATPTGGSSTSRSATATPRSCGLPAAGRDADRYTLLEALPRMRGSRALRRLRAGVRDRRAVGPRGHLRHAVRRRLHARDLRAAHGQARRRAGQLPHRRDRAAAHGGRAAQLRRRGGPRPERADRRHRAARQAARAARRGAAVGRRAAPAAREHRARARPDRRRAGLRAGRRAEHRAGRARRS